MIDGMPGAPFEGEVLIRRRRWASDESGFAVVDAERDGDELVLVGLIAHLEERERVRIAGRVAGRPAVRAAGQGRRPPSRSRRPATPRSLTYLKRVRHVGKGRAAKLLERYGEDVLDAIDRDPHAAFRAAGLNPKRTSEAIRSWNGMRSSRALHLLLAPHGLAWLVPRIATHYGERAHHVVREHPYELTSVFGVGFQTADTIARSGGVGADSAARTRAGVVHVLAEAERDGSTCLPVAELATRAAALLGTGPPDAALLEAMVDDDDLVLEVDAERAVWAYRPPIAALEAELAAQVRELAGGKPRLTAPDQPPDDDPASAGAPRRFARAGAGAVGRRPGRVHVPPLDRHGRPGHGQDGDDPAAVRRRGGAGGLGRAGGAHGARRAADGRVDRRRGVDDPLRARLGPRPGADARRARGRPADRRRDVDGEPRAARDAPARGRAAHARRARRRRRPARAGRRRQAVRRAGRGGRRARRASSPTSSARRRGA